MSDNTTATGSGTFPGSAGHAGAEWFLTAGSQFNSIAFLVSQIVAGKAFAALVQVKSVSGGGIGRPPIATVQPMVNQVDGLGNQVPHGAIYNIPCFRLQGGNGAVILDPAVNDIGMAIICDRDISTVKSTTKPGPPGSRRQNDWADGCYFGGFLNAAPTQYVAFGAGGINITTPGTLTITATETDIAGVLKNNGHLVGSTHVHGGVQTGGGNTGVPT
jgi:hypothetical protein